MTREEREDAINYFKNKLENEVYGAKYNKLAIEALEQEQTTKIEESNFSQEQYKADLQSAYDCGLKRLLSQDDYCLVSVASVKRALEQETRWIPVSERMPEEDVDVLVTLEYGLIGIMQKKLADDDNGEPCYIWQDFEGEEHEVIAWMPLPKPYEADRSEHEKGEA